MKIETLGKMLIAAGVAISLYAMAMPISLRNSGVVNLQLISERQNTLIFGGLIFMAGIILFAVFKLKQTNEESDVAEKLSQERTEKAKVLVESTLQKSSEGASLAAKSFIEALDQKPRSTMVRLAAGVLLGGYAAGCISNFSSFVVYTFTTYVIESDGVVLIIFATIGTFTAYAFRKIGTLKVLIHLAIAAAVSTATIPVHAVLINIKLQECKKATYVTPYCMTLLYNPQELGE